MILAETASAVKNERMKKIVVLTGAGISAESGLSTFRDAGGLWDNYPVEQVATPEGWARDPSLVTRFYNNLRRQLLSVRPSRAHELLARLEQHYDVTVVTQNVDDLHERAGSTRVIHLHGELMKVARKRPKWNPAHSPPTARCYGRGLYGSARPSRTWIRLAQLPRRPISSLSSVRR